MMRPLQVGEPRARLLAGVFAAVTFVLIDVVSAQQVDASKLPRPDDSRSFWMHQYAFIDKNLTWDAAKQHCEHFGGHLVTIESPEEHRFLLHWCRDSLPALWVGASDVQQEGDWRWITGMPVDRGMLQASFDDTEHQQNWLAYWPDSRGWNDRESAAAPFLCEWDNVIAPTHIPDAIESNLTTAVQRYHTSLDNARAAGLRQVESVLRDVSKRLERKTEANVPQMRVAVVEMLAEIEEGRFPQVRLSGVVNSHGHDYAMLYDEQTWHVAQTVCEALGGHLATITSSEEDAAVRQVLQSPGGNTWLGATDEVSEGDWRWVTGEPFSLRASFDNHGGVDHYLHYADNGEYHDWRGDGRLLAVCEWESTAPAGYANVGSNRDVLRAFVDAHLALNSIREQARRDLFREVHDAAQRATKAEEFSTAAIDPAKSYGQSLYRRFGFGIPPVERVRIRVDEYYLFTEPATWHEAKRKCEEVGGQLAVLDGAGEANVVMRRFGQKTAFWIGASAELAPNEYHWIGGKPCPLIYKPTADPQWHCHLMYSPSDRGWAETVSGRRMAYLCKWTRLR